MKIEDEQGYLIVASNNSTDDYIACARVLAKSIKHNIPCAKVCLLTDTQINSDVFDYIKVFPYGDQATTDWKLKETQLRYLFQLPQYKHKQKIFYDDNGNNLMALAGLGATIVDAKRWWTKTA